jgi:hypothetical protein
LAITLSVIGLAIFCVSRGFDIRFKGWGVDVHVSRSPAREAGDALNSEE